MSSFQPIALWQLPGTTQTRQLTCHRCGRDCTDTHAPDCDVSLASCVRCKRPVIRWSTRPLTGTLTHRCGHCGTLQEVPQSLTRPGCSGCGRAREECICLLGAA